MSRVWVRAAIPQLCLALLLGLGLTAGLGATIVYHRVWIELPPPSAQIVGPPAANNSPTLQQQINR